MLGFDTNILHPEKKQYSNENLNEANLEVWEEHET